MPRGVLVFMLVRLLLGVHRQASCSSVKLMPLDVLVFSVRLQPLSLLFGFFGKLLAAFQHDVWYLSKSLLFTQLGPSRCAVIEA